MVHNVDAREDKELKIALLSRDETVNSNSKFAPEGLFTRDKYSSSMSDKDGLKSGLEDLQEVKLSDSVIISLTCMYKG
jgi:hypothetical protein